jgi:hypothetical protein
MSQSSFDTCCCSKHRLSEQFKIWCYYLLATFDLRGVGSTLPQLGHLKLSQDVPPVILVLKSLNTLVSVEDSQFSRPDVRWTAFPLVGSLISF